MAYNFHWAVIWEFRDALLGGLVLTVQLFVVTVFLSVGLGVVVGTLGAGKSKLLRAIANSYVEFNRNLPIVVSLFFLYFAVGLDAFPAAIISLTLHQSGYIAEIVRAGIQSVDRGQFEAGWSTGLSTFAIMHHVVVPQALIIVIPAMTTQVVELLKNTALAMTVGVSELTFQAQRIEGLTFRGFEAATAGTIAYLIIGIGLSTAASRIEYWLTERRLHTPELRDRGLKLASILASRA